jgi:hypothetical protein
MVGDERRPPRRRLQLVNVSLENTEKINVESISDHP